MKYLVNTRTKEHIRYNDDKMSPVGIWKIVEADEDGWIPWGGGECPLPDDARCEIKTMPAMTEQWACELSWHHSGRPWDITAYRPILSETAEKVEKQQYTEPTKVELLFDRLKSAIAASESIPGIIAEIDALLPDGYCVTKREAVEQKQATIPGVGGVILTEAAEDMGDWRNWVGGDLLECIEAKSGYLTEGACYTMTDREYGFVCILKDDTGETGRFNYDRFRFHSRPVKP